MKYKVGDRVRIKSLDWYNENKDKNGNIVFSSKVPHFALCVNVRTVFTKDMVKYCGKVVTIENVWTANYSIVEGTHRDYFTDEMIEGLVEEETKPKFKFKVGDEVRIKGTDIGGTVESVIRGQLIVNYKDSKIPAWPEDVVLMKSVEEETKPNIIEEAKTYWDSIKGAWICPEGYIFKDENCNIINATKIVLEKKKEYPITIEECCKILGFLNVDLCFNADYRNFDASKEQWKRLGLMNQFYQLLICRDAYWKIAGEEMGLGKPWEPTMETVYCISRNDNVIKCSYRGGKSNILEFPTEEMRDAFYENFKEEIEQCKELL